MYEPRGGACQGETEGELGFGYAPHTHTTHPFCSGFRKEEEFQEPEVSSLSKRRRGHHLGREEAGEGSHVRIFGLDQ